METWRHESKVQRYGQIYEEVRALRKETRHSVQDLRERFKEKGVIQNKDQFIVKLIAQVGGWLGVSSMGFVIAQFMKLWALVACFCLWWCVRTLNIGLVIAIVVVFRGLVVTPGLAFLLCCVALALLCVCAVNLSSLSFGVVAWFAGAE